MSIKSPSTASPVWSVLLAISLALIVSVAIGAGAAADQKPDELEELLEEDVEEIIEEVRAISPVVAERRMEDLREHIERVEETAHAVQADPNSPAGQAAEGEQFCYACHGDGFEHFYNIGDDITTDQANETCLDCHSGGERMHWHGGAHEFQDMACIDCHNAHSDNERLLRAEDQLQLCSDCHQERRVDFHRPHHHPVREGQVECSDCHNPHGEVGSAQLREGEVNETCYQCHAEYRGPFLWEHQPVREDCTQCHDPHGSVHPGMLESRTAQVCQSCHVTLGHPGDVLGADPGDDIPQQGQFMVRGQGCMNCHSEVHGSNHPGGALFQR
ncbi:periplasmic decaheme cytochrome c [Halorhodospira halochloris]|uniref:Periplasmic decaheme cytochrome c n=1 Tax=Halorhodospira halochloris TaxID=1052 RepID=A0A120MZE8_HALHR|nr:DmsE family decaheme c-type cytochrome [Halorhodospira halochloris]BAU56608.1 periplasmic decaheme cytochrome c [Halorhodospira halochloris]